MRDLTASSSDGSKRYDLYTTRANLERKDGAALTNLCRSNRSVLAGLVRRNSCLLLLRFTARIWDAQSGQPWSGTVHDAVLESALFQRGEKIVSNLVTSYFGSKRKGAGEPSADGQVTCPPQSGRRAGRSRWEAVRVDVRTAQTE